LWCLSILAARAGSGSCVGFSTAVAVRLATELAITHLPCANDTATICGAPISVASGDGAAEPEGGTSSRPPIALVERFNELGTANANGLSADTFRLGV